MQNHLFKGISVIIVTLIILGILYYELVYSI